MMILARSAIAALVAFGLLVPQQVALAANQTFAGIHYLVPTGKKSQQLKGRLVLTEEALQVHGHRGTALVKELPYSAITGATYSKSKHPRWKTTLAAGALVLGPFALPLLFMKGKKHWLTVQSEGEYVALRLSKKNYMMVLSAFESEAGLKVDRIIE